MSAEPDIRAWASPRPPPAFVPVPEDPALCEEVVAELLLEAEEARGNLIRFVEFVMRTEKREFVKLAPHHRLCLEFYESFRRGVELLPRGHGKTWLAAAIILYELGRDPSCRVGLFGAAQDGPSETLQLVKDYIEGSDELRLVFPGLRRGTRRGDKWTDTELVIDRPRGTRHPSVQAFGIESAKIRGKRLDRAIIDDCLSEENTTTQEQRETVHRKVQGKIIPTVEPSTGKVFFLNTAFFEDDTVHRHARLDEERGWPALVMRSDGEIQIRHADEFDSREIVPADDRAPDDPRATYRLAEHQPDPDHQKGLWFSRFPPEHLAAIREDMHPVEFERNYQNRCRNDATSLCRQEYVDKAREMGWLLGLERMLPARPSTGFDWPVFVGVDTAFSESSSADETAIFVMAILPEPGFDDRPVLVARDGKPARRAQRIRVPIWVEHGRWATDEVARRLLDMDARWRPLAFAFESNGAQEGVRKLLATYERTLVLKPHRTDATKNSIVVGVPSLFGEMANGAWAIPNRKGKALEAPLKKWTQQCLDYDPRSHTGDLVMASYFARDLARKWGQLTRPAVPGQPRKGAAAASVLAR